MKRKDINLKTLEKVRKFLEKNDYVYKSDICNTGVDWNSLEFALTKIDHETDEKGRIKIKR